MEKIELVAEEDLETMFYESLMKHQLPDYFLYMGSEGAKNWLSLDRSEKFTVARQLTQLLQENTSDIGNLIPEDMNFVSVGVGNGEKERIILKELINKYIPTYYPVDINGTLVDMAMQTVQELPVEKKGIVGFIEDMPLLKNLWNPPVMFSILGNTWMMETCSFLTVTYCRNPATLNRLKKLSRKYIVPERTQSSMSTRWSVTE
jgi:uncharacterized SAM-dependent methyltransferase